MDPANIHWLGHAAFRIEDQATQIYIDPWKLPPDTPKADVIFITHAHYDHCSPEDIAKVRKESTIILAPPDAGLGVKRNVVSVVPAQWYQVGDLRVQTVPAYNLGKNFHPRHNNWVGYVLKLSTGQTIYHSGDSDFTPEMRSVVADVALLPCGGTYTMTGREAGEAANVFKPGTVIPMHWGDIVGSTKDAEDVKKTFKGKTIILSPER